MCLLEESEECKKAGDVVVVSEQSQVGVKALSMLYCCQSTCLEINFDISTIEVFPVNSNFTLPTEEK